MFFPLLAKAFWNLNWLELALSPTCTQSVAFVADDDLLARILFLSLSCYFLFTLFGSSVSVFFYFSLSFSLYIFLTAVISSLLCIHQCFKRAIRIPSCSEKDSFCRAVGLSSFILPSRYLALIVSRSSMTFYVGFDHPLRRSNARHSGCTFPPHANLIAFLHPSRVRRSRSTDDLNATLRSQDA